MIYKLMKPRCIFKRINEFMIINIYVFSVMILFKYLVTNKFLHFFNRKIRNTIIYKLMKFVYIFKRINEFMTITFDVFIVMFLCKYSVTNKSLIFLYGKNKYPKIYKVMKFVCIFKIISEFMIMIIN